MNTTKLSELCKLIRYDILTATTEAGSGHPTTSMSAVELMSTLFFGGFMQYDLKNPQNPLNDHIIFSKGHATPLLYSLYHVAGAISYDELMTLRKFGSVLEGHPVPRFKYVEVATGALGQGLSIGVGMAMGIKLKIKNLKLKIEREPKVWVLLGDSEVAEGQIWEAMELASYYKLNNLIGILDVNRLGQRGETMLGWDIETYAKRANSFGWQTIVVDDGHNLQKVYEAFEEVKSQKSNVKSPTMIIAKTIKGKGISFLENKDGWHGKPVPKDMLPAALKELGQVDLTVRGKIKSSSFAKASADKQNYNSKIKTEEIKYKLGDIVATREGYGDALVLLGKKFKDILAIDAEVSNSTFADKFKVAFPERFFEMFIAEQNMIGVALGLSKIGYPVFASTFAAFLSRAFDQIRMAQYSQANVKIIQSHTGISIGPDGPSQMALEDIAMMRSILNGIVLYPSDGLSTIRTTELMLKFDGISYLRLTREKTPVIYENNEQFEIGGSKTHYLQSKKSNPKAVIIAAGITLHEALKAQKTLAEDGIETIVMDCYSVKPIDAQSINRLVTETKNVIVVEDHYPYGGIGEAVLSALGQLEIKSIRNFIHLCVRKIPRSGKPAELSHYEEIDADAIIKAVKKVCD